MYTYRTAYSLATSILFILVIGVVIYHGSSNRVFAPGSITAAVDTPEKAFFIWKENRVKGRILLLFDNYPHAKGLINYDGIPQLTPSSFVEFSVFKNIVREIYFIVPEIDWDAFIQQKTIIPIREVPDLERGFYIYNLNGIPFIATTPSSLPHIQEETIVYINKHVFSHEQARDLLSQKNITSDIIVTYQGPGK